MGSAWAVATDSPEATVRVGEALGARLEAGDVVALYGPLGSGKTTFVRGLARGLGASESDVVSPTFVYVREVRGGRLALYHVDAYRLAGRFDRAAAERLMEELGLDWYLQAGGVVAVEWPEPIVGLLPDQRFAVRFAFAGDSERRRLAIEGLGERPGRIVGELARRHGWAPVDSP